MQGGELGCFVAGWVGLAGLAGKVVGDGKCCIAAVCAAAGVGTGGAAGRAAAGLVLELWLQEADNS